MLFDKVLAAHKRNVQSFRRDCGIPQETVFKLADPVQERRLHKSLLRETPRVRRSEDAL